MRYVEKYYEKSILYDKPSALLKKFFDMKLDENIDGKIAIDLGCGAGNDTIFLLNKGFHVIAVDKEKEVQNIICNRRKDSLGLHFIISDFETVRLSKANLVLSNFSLYFCNPQYFDNLMNEVIKNIKNRGYFVGNFIGNEDEWAHDDKRTFVTKEKIMKIFKDFKVVYFEEKKYNKDSLKIKNKFWHVFNIIAKKEKV